MPQPISTSNLPPGKRRSTPRLRVTAKANSPTPTALAMRKANDGSQRPVMSGKPSTLAGSAVPETISPKPNSAPARSVGFAQLLEDRRILAPAAAARLNFRCAKVGLRRNPPIRRWAPRRAAALHQ